MGVSTHHDVGGRRTGVAVLCARCSLIELRIRVSVHHDVGGRKTESLLGGCVMRKVQLN